MTPQLDIAATRAARNYSSRETILRVLWIIGAALFRFSPRPCFAWRRWVLRLFGAKIGQHVHVYPSARIYHPWNLTVGDWSAIGEEVLVYNLGHIKVGQRVTVSHRAQLCAGTHDHTRVDFPLLKQPIEIGDQAWICAAAFVGPGVHVGHGAVVGAAAVVTKDVPGWSIVAGNPARQIAKRQLSLPTESLASPF